MPLFNNDIHESYQPIRGQKTILRHCGPIKVAPIFEDFPANLPANLPASQPASQPAHLLISQRLVHCSGAAADAEFERLFLELIGRGETSTPPASEAVIKDIPRIPISKVRQELEISINLLSNSIGCLLTL